VAEANTMIPGSLFAAAKAGNITAIIFRLKTRAHWRERTAEGAIANPDTGSNSEFVPLLRDHNRDLSLTPVLQDVQQKYLRRETPQAAALDLRHRGYEPLSC
jgi:hypothetical protein